MSVSELRESCGYATLEPDGEVVAGSYGTWRLTYAAGYRGVAAGGNIRVYTDSDTDRGTPQFDDPAGADYTTVAAPEEARVNVLVQNVKSLIVAVNGRGLKPGEKVVITYGDRSGGGPGFRAQTFLEGRHYFRVAVDAEGDGRYTALPDPPYLRIAGGEADRLVVVAPSTAAVGRPFRLLVKAEDAWGNPAAAYRGTVEVQAAGVEVSEARLNFSRADRGVRWVEGCIPSQAGLIRVVAVDTQGGLAADSNPIQCAGQAGRYDLYWGDFHGGQVELAEKIPDFFRYARDVAGIDFAGYQRNDHSASNEDWTLQQRAEREFYEPGRFVPVPGFEWSAQTEMGGHHNVYFRRHNQPIRRCSHSRLEDKSDVSTDLPHVLDVYRTYRNVDVVITPHVGGQHSDLTYHEPTLEPAIEVTSTHGTFEWFLEEALLRRYKLGFFGGSDSHTGRPGGDRPGHQLRRYAKAGLAAVYATGLTLEALLDALKARRCYGTTGARMLVRTEADGHLMGEEYATSFHPAISVFVAGTAPLESVEIFRGLERVYTHPMNLTFAENRVRILWEGASRKSSYSGVIWDGCLKVAGGKIASVEKVRFDSPRSRVFDVETEGLSWHSVTCGYRSGIVLDLDGNDDTELQVVLNTSLFTRMACTPAEKLCFSVSLQELAAGPKEIKIGELNRKVTVSLAPGQGAAESVEFTFTDPSPAPGINPYWIRVVQTDMEMAWTSPIFVDYVAPPV